MTPSFVFLFFLIHLKVSGVFTYFDGLPGDSDVFKNPNCGSPAKDPFSASCDCAGFNAQCLRWGCRECKCRKATRIYRSDVRKCLSDLEARDPWCRYQFFKTRPDVIPTIDLSRACSNNKCSQPINAPFDKTKHVCHVSWVNYLENGTWQENPVRKFQETFDLRGSDYFSEKGYMYSLEWKTSQDSGIPKRLFQVSLECIDQDSKKESYCLMFRVKGKGESILYSASNTRRKIINRPQTKEPTRAVKPTKYIRRRVNTRMAKVVVVNDNFTIILAAIAGAVGTAVVIIPLALFFRRSTRDGNKRPQVESSALNTISSRCRRNNCEHERQRVGEGIEVDVETETSHETLSSYTSLKRNRETDDPPSIYQSLNTASNDNAHLAYEEPIYISVSGDEEDEPVKNPPIYHVLEQLNSDGNVCDSV